KFLAQDRRQMSYCGVTGSHVDPVPLTKDCPKTRTAGKYCVWYSGSTSDIFGPNTYNGLIVEGWGTKLKKVTDGTSKTLMIGERWYMVRAWMIGAYWRLPSEPTATSLGSAPPPDGPQPNTALFATKNLSPLAPINNDPRIKAYIDHQNVYTDRPG